MLFNPRIYIFMKVGPYQNTDQTTFKFLGCEEKVVQPHTVYPSQYKPVK